MILLLSSVRGFAYDLLVMIAFKPIWIHVAHHSRGG